MTDPKKMSNDELTTRYFELTQKFDQASHGDPFGWDWPTMHMVFPEEAAEARALQAEAKRRRLCSDQESK